MEKKKDLARESALFRYGLIAPAVQGSHGEASQAAYFRKMSEMEFTAPDGRKARYKPGTLSKWASDYKKGGLEALEPQARSDKEKSRKFGLEAIEC